MKAKKHTGKSELKEKFVQEAVKKQHKREKEEEGEFMEVPDYFPKTSIFIERGQDPEEVFQKFKMQRGEKRSRMKTKTQ